ncbi:hypothetical protein RB195_009727 [Necator americanus]|uniref:Phlebovirus glycoprotein G2 fusion domain-containing protein n=2 Tax=Necator americanus TaxID=51031 RepID=A0ABR1CVX5_NECAM
MGGAWERLVGLTKKAFNKSIGRKRLSFADMCTVITRIEAILNTRPLTKLNSSDIAEIPLRPIDFLKGNFNYSLPNDKVANVSGDPDYDPNLIQTEKQALEAFQTSEMIANKFWEKWNVEYLTSLRETQKINLKQPRHLPRSLPEIGEIVLIEEELIPRGCWSYGRITEIIYSADGSVRSAKVLLPNRKIIHRPLNKIFPLEIRSAPEDTTINTQKDQHQPNQERRKLPARASKTEAYEIIRDYELGLEGAQYTIPRTPLALTIIAMLSMISPTLAECVPKIACVKGKINISPPKGSFQLCFDEHCRTFNEVTKNLTYTVPISPHNDQVKVALIMIGNHSMETLETTCNRPDFCDHHYFLSKALLGNPHCWPAGAIATLAVVIYIFAVILAILVWSMYKLRHANKAVPMEQLPMITTRHNRSNSPNAFVPAPLPCLTAICLILTTVLTSANACQRGYMRHSANLICNEQSKCFYQYNEELLFNRLTSKICIQINHSNKTLGFIRVTKKPIKLTCSKVLEFFTRETEVRVYHVERCAQAGSCVDNKCHTMPSNETVHELRKYKRYPGYSGCISICGGIPCGCLLPLPACQFYRVVNRPTSRSIYEVIRCADWTASIELEIEVILMGKNTKKSLSMRPYVTEIVERVDITVISLQKPTITAINQRYAISENAAFILPDRFVVPVECSDEVQAQTQFSTCTNRIRCHCENAHRCQCPEESLSHLRNSSALPIETPSYNLTKEDDSVMTITEEGEFVLTLDSKILVNASEIVTKKKCEIQTIDLTGCYNCEHGARLVTRCRSQLDIRVTVVCKTFEFVIHCGPMNVNKTTLLAFDHAIVRETCTTDCSENVDIKGVLSYHIGLNTAVFEASDHYVLIRSQWFSDWSIPDVTPMITALAKHWKITVAALASTVILTALTYVAGPVVLLYLAKCAVYPFKMLLAAGRFLCCAAKEPINRQPIPRSATINQNWIELAYRSNSCHYSQSSGPLESPACGLPAEEITRADLDRAEIDQKDQKCRK